MRLMRAFTIVVSYTILAAAPTLAGQRGHQSPATPPAHPTAATKTSPAPQPHVVPQQIASNPALVTRLTPLLPSGMTLESAAAGFKNQGQFIAALHVSHNLNIPFADLKADMTGAKHLSLGQSIHDLRPATADTKTAVKRAESSAQADIKATKRAKRDADDRERR